MRARIIGTTGLKRIDLHGGLNMDGHVEILPRDFYKKYKMEEIAAFCVRAAIYNVPTLEQIDALAQLFGDSDVVEIGAGNGVLAGALANKHVRIRAVDNYMQTFPEVAMAYRLNQQPTIKYGQHVIRMDGLEYVRKVKPAVVLGCWITHRYNPAEPLRGGNMYGPDELELLQHAGTYVHIGNAKVHAAKPLHELTHRRYVPPWLVSRAFEPEFNEVRIWGATLPGEAAWQDWRKGLTPSKVRPHKGEGEQGGNSDAGT